MEQMFNTPHCSLNEIYLQKLRQEVNVEIPRLTFDGDMRGFIERIKDTDLALKIMKPPFDLSHLRTDSSINTWRCSTLNMGNLKERIDASVYRFDFDVPLLSDGENLKRSSAWDLQQRQSFILMILSNQKDRDNVAHMMGTMSILIQEGKYIKGYGIGFVETYYIIDGEQRLTAMLDFMSDKFPIIVNGYEYLYSEIGSFAQRAISGQYFQSDIVYYSAIEQLSPKDRDKILIEWFCHINNEHTPRNIENIHRLKQYL